MILWKPSLLLSQGRFHARHGRARPKAPQGHKYNPIGAQGGDQSIHPLEVDAKRRHRRESTTAASPRVAYEMAYATP
jgi:hypothetical protein